MSNLSPLKDAPVRERRAHGCAWAPEAEGLMAAASELLSSETEAAGLRLWTLVFVSARWLSGVRSLMMLVSVFGTHMVTFPQRYQCAPALTHAHVHTK